MTDKIKAELLAIQKSSKNGILHAANVVAWAKRNRKSALHRQFEWNNSKAAQEYRLWQARRIVQLNITTEGGDPVLVSLSYDRPRGGGYRPIETVISNKKLRAVMLQDALNELERVQIRYEHLSQLSAVWKAIKRARKPTLRVVGKKSAQRQLAKAA